MISIGPVLIIIGVYAIVGTFLAIIHRALRSSETAAGEPKSVMSQESNAGSRANERQPAHSVNWAI